jgi:hypothetical protein
LSKFSKNYSTFFPKKWSLSSKKYEFGIRDPGKPIPDPGPRIQKGTGTLILIMAYSIIQKILENVSYLRMSVLLAGVLHEVHLGIGGILSPPGNLRQQKQ